VPTKSGLLAEQLRNQILFGELLPGEAIPSQRQLVEQQGASRATVREAIQELENGGLIETRHGGRSRCLNLVEPWLELPVEGFGDHKEEQLQVLEVREALEGEAAYYAAIRATDQQLELIGQEYQEMLKRSSGATTLSKAKADLQFHMMIAEASHHLLVCSFSQIFYSRYFNAIYGVLDRTLKKIGRYPEGINAQHAQIYQALLNRDADQAKAVATDHIAYTRRLLEIS